MKLNTNLYTTSQHKMAFNDFTGLLIAPEPEMPKNYKTFDKFIVQSRAKQQKYDNKRRSTTKNFKRFNQFQPRNRGTNHTLMRKGNTW